MIQARLSSVLHLVGGDLASRALALVAFVYIARVVGADRFGTLEFAVSSLAYFLLLGDCGLEIWAIRATAMGLPVPHTAARVLALRILLSLLSYAVLFAITPAMPDYPRLPLMLLLFGLALIPQALNLKWVYVGRERMRTAAGGLLAAQIVFAAIVLIALRDPNNILWVPVARVLSELAGAVYFAVLYVREYGLPSLQLFGSESIGVLRGALAVGAVQGIGLLSYNFDMLLLGFLRTAADVGWYSAAYKPVTVALALPLACFGALFPGLARAHAAGKEQMIQLVRRSLRLTTALVLPVGILGSFLAGPAVILLFGAEYDRAAAPLQILCWSAVLVTIRSNFKHSLTAGRHSAVDLKSSSVAIAVNIILNLLFIPVWGAPGAAVATVISDIVWLSLAAAFFHSHIGSVGFWSALSKPAAAAVVMSACLFFTEALPAWERATFAVLVYAGTLVLLFKRLDYDLGDIAAPDTSVSLTD